MKTKQFFKNFKVGMSSFGQNIALIINTILLSIVYIIAFSLTSLIAKMFGKHFLDIKKKDSYWSDLNLKKKSIEEYYRQF